MERMNTPRDAAITSLVNASMHSAHLARERFDREHADEVFGSCMAALAELGVTLEEVTRAADFIKAESTWLASTRRTAKLIRLGDQ
jgi:hypothetical protein